MNAREPVISAEGLSKCYRIPAAGREQYQTLRDEVVRAVGRLVGRGEPRREDEVWALRDVSFVVDRGEAVGIIGRNGAGKSTLLKLLAQITEPTAGRAVLQGRVGSLLEVGTGFHPELTGRENIFLSGAILGMTRQEIRTKFDAMVEFAEVERFVDVPVKRYSSGMFVRLAFAVAAHLQPEILLVDEVLAVGDVQFQQRCLRKMGEVTRSGLTILFVSHNMAAVTSLCERTILLNDGRVLEDGPSPGIARRYLELATAVAPEGDRDLTKAVRSGGDGKVRFTRVRLTNARGEVTTVFDLREPIRIDIWLESEIPVECGEIGFALRSASAVVLLTSSSTDEREPYQLLPGRYQLHVVIDPNHLRAGHYWVQLGTTCGILRDLVPEAIQFEISSAQHYSKTMLYSLNGFFHFPFPWSELTRSRDASDGRPA